MGSYEARLLREEELAQRDRDARLTRRLHENHVDLLARCELCRQEAGAQTDRLTDDDDGGPMDGTYVTTY